MVDSMRPVRVTAGSDWAHILDKAANQPLLLERDGVLFRLSRENPDNDITYKPDAELVLRMLDETAGSWADLDIDHIIEDVYAARDTGSRTSDHS